MKLKRFYIERFLFSAVLGILVFFTHSFAQDDKNPNSPIPVLISENDSNRALTDLSETSRKNLRQADFFKVNSRINLFVTNIELLKDEDFNAFRVYAEDGKGGKFRFPVLDLQPVKNRDWIYKVTVLLQDELGFHQLKEESGEINLRLTWRGLSSNIVRIGIGKTLTELKKDSNFASTPLKNYLSKPEKIEKPLSEYVGDRYSGDRKRFQEQAAFGPSAQLDQQIRRIGQSRWLEQQFSAPYPGSFNPYPNPELRTSLQVVGCWIYLPPEERRICDRDYYSMYPVQNWFFKEALYGEPQLKHKVAWSLSQIWVISGKTTQQARHLIEYHKILSRNAFGNYRTLMKEMTLNPAMGNYLDLARNSAYSPNENYARELLQLFTIGLFMLNQDGTLQLDANNQPIPTYTQETVENFTKVLTGWTFCYEVNNPDCPSITPGTINFIDPMFLEVATHNPNAKTLLNYPNAVSRDIPAGQSGYEDLEQAMDNIFYHPNVAPFVSRLLIQHLVTSDPTPAYVGRVSAVFRNNGSGVRGDLKAVVRAILLDPEARGDFKTDPNYGKLREPVQFITNILRQFDVRSADGTQNSDGVLAKESKKMGQDVFYSNTVFNYYSPGYVIPGTAYNAPEFGIMTTSTAVSRANAANKFIFENIPVGQDIPHGTSINLNGLRQLIEADSTGNQLINELDRKLMHNTMSLQMKNKILNAITQIPVSEPDLRARTALFLVISSSQYQIQR